MRLELEGTSKEGAIVHTAAPDIVQKPAERLRLSVQNITIDRVKVMTKIQA